MLPGLRQRRRILEWPTIFLAIAIHGGWLAATWWHDRLPLWLLPIVGGWLIAWHGSLQHETIHGHPTGIRAIDGLIGGAPLVLWLPYSIYRRTHLAHHVAHVVTDPYEDPESRYLPAATSAMDQLSWMMERVQASLAGRLLLGPPLTIARFLAGEISRLRRAPISVLGDWAPHLAGVGVVLWWLHVCGIDIGLYMLAFVYPGVALSLLRSYAEHRADPDPHRRVAVVERAGPFALLFLHNNLHAAHHRAPGLAWYRLPGFYQRHRARLLAGNGGLVYRGYGEVVRRYFFRAHHQLLHPDHGLELTVK